MEKRHTFLHPPFSIVIFHRLFILVLLLGCRFVLNHTYIRHSSLDSNIYLDSRVMSVVHPCHTCPTPHRINSIGRFRAHRSRAGKKPKVPNLSNGPLSSVATIGPRVFIREMRVSDMISTTEVTDPGVSYTCLANYLWKYAKTCDVNNWRPTDDQNRENLCVMVKRSISRGPK
jgi:hypothetical protein